MEVKDVAVSDIVLSESNTRKDLQAGLEDAGLSELAESIRTRGLLNPVTVMRRSDGRFDLIAGQRRFLACSKLGMKTIPAIVKDVLDSTDATIISLVENVQRADMNPMDKANAFQKISERYHDLNKVATETGVTVPTVKKYLSLLKLAPRIQEMMNTAEGPTGISTMSRLAETFDAPEEQESALKEIGPFKQSVQLEILKRSQGDLGRLSELRAQALEGAFDVRACREGLCFDMPTELKDEIKRILRSKEGFEEIIERIAR